MTEEVTADRPRAEALLPRLVDEPGKLSWRAASLGVDEWRCPHLHLVAALIKIPSLGPWLYRRGNSHGDPHGDAWRCDWQADLASPIVDAWCTCRKGWQVDTLSPGTPPRFAID